MPSGSPSIAEWLFGPGPAEPGSLLPRWLWLRALGLIFFSAFYSLAFQIRGLVGPDGILPAGSYLQEVAQQFGSWRFWYAPSLLWLGTGSGAVKALWIAGLAASILLILNLWPRAAIAVCFLAYLSFVSIGQDFAEYQSDGMLLSAAFLSLFIAPPGLRPRLGCDHRPSRAGLFMLQWLWLRIYFESGVVKLASHDPQWRRLTALDQYYQNGPLPNWIGWYAQQLPHGFQAAIALTTLTVELGLVWLLFLPRRFRLILFFIVTPFQVGIILTANLAFLNHLVLSLGILLLDDRFLRGALRWVKGRFTPAPQTGSAGGLDPSASDRAAVEAAVESLRSPGGLTAFRHRLSIVASAVILSWIFYATFIELLTMFVPRLPVPLAPVTALEPFRIADQYGLFAVMTTARYEIEFQGSDDGQTWVAYPFRYKPQRLDEPPRYFAPYQPRFDWNLWFATLGTWRQYSWVVRTEVLLLENDSGVLTLLAGNPFSKAPPKQVRAVEWQYWFTDLKTRRGTGAWWRREFRGLYGPIIERAPDGKVNALQWPDQQ
ncbi:MAG TPA: lipase maturation factor family protein [Terriglobia bacterium]